MSLVRLALRLAASGSLVCLMAAAPAAPPVPAASPPVTVATPPAGPENPPPSGPISPADDERKRDANIWSDLLAGPIAAAIAAGLGVAFTWLAGAARRRQLKMEAQQKADDAANERRKAELATELAERERQRATEEASRASGAAQQAAAEQVRAAEEKQRADEQAQRAADALKVLEEHRRALRLPKLPVDASRRCSVLLLGIGGTGKSTLVRSMFGVMDQVEGTIVEAPEDELPSSPHMKGLGSDDKKTRRVRTWDERIPWDHSAIALSITDYVGQNLGTLVRFFAKAQKEPYSPVAYGWINAVVFVVDLRTPAPEKSPNARVPRSDEPEWKRIEANIAAWNWQAVSTVWGMLTKPRFKRIVIVVKKSDLLNRFGDKERKAVREAYQPLFEVLKLVFPDQEPMYICGPDGERDEAMQLKEALWDAADEVKKQ